jgi:serine/threonine protein kinase
MIELKRIKESKSLKSKLKNEISTMKSLDHPGILKLVETIQTKDYFCIVLEYASGGDFFELISNSTKVNLHNSYSLS